MTSLQKVKEKELKNLYSVRDEILERINNLKNDPLGSGEMIVADTLAETISGKPPKDQIASLEMKFLIYKMQ